MAKSEPVEVEVDFRRGSGWRVSVPNALVIALVTAVSTGAVSRCTAREPAEDVKQELREIKSAVAESERKVLRKLEDVERDSKNRDVVQDASIAALRNR
jgi:hypothetical protein